MLYTDFEAGNKTYKLRLNTRATIALEKTIGCNPLMIFGDGDTVPEISTMVAVLHSALQPLQHGITLNDAYDIFDEYLEEHAATDFIAVIVDVFKVSGLIPRDKAEVDEKNV